MHKQSLKSKAKSLKLERRFQLSVFNFQLPCGRGVYKVCITHGQVAWLYMLSTESAKYLTSKVFWLWSRLVGCTKFINIYAQAVLLKLSPLPANLYTLYTAPIITTKYIKEI